jgi:hypothetical protein
MKLHIKFIIHKDYWLTKDFVSFFNGWNWDNMKEIEWIWFENEIDNSSMKFWKFWANWLNFTGNYKTNLKNQMEMKNKNMNSAAKNYEFAY